MLQACGWSHEVYFSDRSAVFQHRDESVCSSLDARQCPMLEAVQPYATVTTATCWCCGLAGMQLESWGLLQWSQCGVPAPWRVSLRLIGRPAESVVWPTWCHRLPTAESTAVLSRCTSRAVCIEPSTRLLSYLHSRYISWPLLSSQTFVWRMIFRIYVTKNLLLLTVIHCSWQYSCVLFCWI